MAGPEFPTLTSVTLTEREMARAARALAVHATVLEALDDLLGAAEALELAERFCAAGAVL